MNSLFKGKYDLSEKETATQIIKDFKKNEKISLSNREKKEIIKRIEQNISLGKFNFSFNYLILGLLYNRNETLDSIKRRGIFRYSKYIKSRCIVDKLCTDIISVEKDLYLANEQLIYFESVRNLSPILLILREKHHAIIREIRNFKRKPSFNGRKKSFIRTLIAFIEYLFLTGYYPKKRENPNSLKFYTRENISEAVSYIIFLHSELFNIKKHDFGIIDEDYILSNKIEKVLLDACKFKDLQEFEIYIDHFSYRCESKKHEAHIYPPFPALEKSIRLGYIRTDLQSIYDLKEYENIVSLEEIINKLNKDLKKEIFKYTDTKNYPRYIFEIPESIKIFLNTKFFNSDKIFKEEVQYIEHILKEEFIDFYKLKTLHIRSNLSLFEFLKIKRFFIFLYILLFKKFLEKIKEESVLILRSLVPVFKKDFLYTLLEKLTSKEKLDSFLDIVTWNPDKNIIFDLQYQPFLTDGELYLVPLSLFVNSNTIRNIYALEYKLRNPDIFDDGRYDLLSALLSSAFQSQGFTTKQKIEHSFNKGGDIDFLAYKDDFLFIAECKKSLLPTSIYELRTLYDHMNKANKQLNLTLKAIKDPETNKEICQKIDYDLSKIKNIKTAIVTNNRLFVGVSLWDHPVRNIQEFVNIVEKGIVKTEKGNFSVWKNNYFTVEDLTYYLEDMKFHKHFYDAMAEKQLIYNFKNIKIVFTTFYLIPEKVSNSFEKLRYKKMDEK